MNARVTPGEVYSLIDCSGYSHGICIFIKVHEPFTLSDKRVAYPSFWNFEILHMGEIKFFNTSNWSLIPITDE